MVDIFALTVTVCSKCKTVLEGESCLCDCGKWVMEDNKYIFYSPADLAHIAAKKSFTKAYDNFMKGMYE